MIKRLILYTAVLALIYATIGYTKELDKTDYYSWEYCTKQIAPDYSFPQLKILYYANAIECLRLR